MFGISIVTSCYNVGEMLFELLRSIEEQDIKMPYEVIVVDDASTDLVTLDVLHKIEGSSVRVLNFSWHRGNQYARNFGISLARYEYIFMIDADDKLNCFENNSFLDLAVDLLKSDSDVAFVYSQVQMFGEKNELRNQIQLDEKMIMRKYRVPIGLVYRKQDLDNFPYAEDIQKWQDWSFAVGLLNRRLERMQRNKILQIQKPYYAYRIYNSCTRISATQACLYDAIQKTIRHYPTIFKHYYEHMTEREKIRFLVANSAEIRGYIPHICKECKSYKKCYL